MYKNKLYTLLSRNPQITATGRILNIVLLWLILLSVLAVSLESIPSLHRAYKHIFRVIEWVFTIVFTLEYVVRVATARKPFKYALSFWGIIDLISFLPTYIVLFYANSYYLVFIRLLRLLRIFRIFKLTMYIRETTILLGAFGYAFKRIMVFLVFFTMIVLVMGSLMYVVEYHHKGFESIPNSIYWAIVTITTVGYGDIVPETAFGKFISTVVMFSSYAMIALLTSVLTVEMSKTNRQKGKSYCDYCHISNPPDANFCCKCGQKLRKH